MRRDVPVWRVSLAAARLLNRKLGGRISPEPVVGDWYTAAHRAAERALVEATLSPADRLEPVAQTPGNGVVGQLAGEGLGQVTPVPWLVGRRPVVEARANCTLKDALDASPLEPEQLTTFVLVHC